MKKSIMILAAFAMPLLGFVSCNKADVALPEEEILQEEETITLAEAVDVLTKSISKEDLEGLSLFVKEGNADESLYLKVEKNDKELVSGEVSRTAGQKYKIIGLDLMVMGMVPITGTVDICKLGIYMAEAALCQWNGDLLQKALDKANGTIDLQVMYTSHLEFQADQDEETGEYSIEAYLVQDAEPYGRVKVSELIAMFS